MNEEKSALIEKIEAKIEQSEARLDLMRARAKEARADRRAEIERQIEELRDRRDAASRHLAEVRRASGDAWQDVVTGAQAAWKSLSSAVDRAADRFG